MVCIYTLKQLPQLLCEERSVERAVAVIWVGAERARIWRSEEVQLSLLSVWR